MQATAPFSRTVFFCVLTLAGCGQSAAPVARVQFPFLAGAEWRGQAEIGEYTGTVTRYGQARPADLTLITVSEPLQPGTLVKAETPGPNVFAGLKQNQVLTYQTGVYPYRQMNSVFWRQAGGEFLRATMTSQEWCGQTMKDMRREGDHYRLSWNSYWEGEAQGNSVVGRPRAEGPALIVLYDELPLLVRTPEFRNLRKVYIFPMLMSSQVKRPDWDIGSSARNPGFLAGVVSPESEQIQVGGRTVNSLRISVRWTEVGQERQETFWVDDESPHRTLLRWRRYDGSDFVVSRTSFAPYWKLNRPGDRLP